MTDKRYPSSTILSVAALLLSAVTLLFASCGVLEVGFESPTRPLAASAPTVTTDHAPAIAPKTPTPVPVDYVSPTSEPAFTPMPVDTYAAPAGLRVAFVKDEDVWLWTAGESDVVPLTTAGEIYGHIRISDDGTIVAFVRGEELWAVNSEGTDERRLVSATDLSKMGAETRPDDPSARINRFAWVPGTHAVAFNTRVRVSDRSVLNHDLRLVDADTLEQTVLLAPGEGGEFTYSPDGKQVALVTPGDVSLIDAHGGNRRDSVLTYTPVDMYHLSDYYVQPTWAADGSALLVAIPPADPQARPIQHTTVWRIPTNGDPAELITTIDALPMEGTVFFSADLNYVAYGEVREAEAGAAERIEIWLKVVRLENGDWFAYPDVSTAYGWAPDSRRFAFVAGRPESQLKIGQWSGPTLPSPIDAGVPIDGVRWVDTYRLLFVARRNWEMGAEGDSLDLVLGDTNGTSTVLASATDHVVYDFTQADPIGSVPAISGNRPTPWPPMATPAPTTTLRVEGMATPHCPINVINERYTRDNHAYPATTIAATAEGAWIGFGSAGGGVWRYLDEAWHVFDQAAGFPISDIVQVLRAAPDGSVWAGAGCQLARYSGGVWQKMAGCDRLKGQVTDVAFTPDGATWVASALELSRFDGRAWTSYSRLAHYLAAGPDGALWVSGWEGSQNSFYVARFDGVDWTTYPTHDPLGHGVSKIAVTPDGDLWGLWGTAGEWGMVRFDGKTWEQYTVADGLPSNVVTQLAVGPDGTLWARGDEGLAYLDGDRWSPVLYEGATGQGLLAVGPDGTVWLGAPVSQ